MRISQEIIIEAKAVTGFSVNKLAKITKVPRPTISNVLTGVNKEFSTLVALKLLKVIAEHAPQARMQRLMLRLFQIIDRMDGPKKSASGANNRPSVGPF